MRQNTSYSLQYIYQIPYLLPFGQAIADHRRGIRLNETGSFIWNTLATVPSKQELISTVLDAYRIPSGQQPEVIQELEDFLSKLTSMGIIDASDSKVSDTQDETTGIANDICTESAQENCDTYLAIGGMILKLTGPSEVIPEEFVPFIIDADRSYPQPDCTITIHMGPAESGDCGTLLLRNRELMIYERTSDYRFLFPAAKQITEGTVTKDGSLAHFYLCPPATDSLRMDLFHALRLIVLYLGQLRGLFMIHSASILYNGKAWLFSGHSGMGKSTHTNLWHTHYGTPLLNGDLNMMELTPNGAVVHGIPWCGTSKISTTETYPLGGIVLLGRSKQDAVEKLSDEEKALLVMQRLISPSWTEEQLAVNLSFAAKLTSQVPVCKLKCTKTLSAVDTVRKWMDGQE
jgi:hypothetical protein